MPATGGAAVQVTSDGGAFPSITADGYLYFVKAATVRTLMRMPLESGKEEMVVDGAMRGGHMWNALTGGVYYLDRSVAPRYFDARSRTHSGPIMQFQYPEITVETSIGACRDGRVSATDVMIVDKFW